MDSLQGEYPGKGSYRKSGQIRAGNCRSEGIRLHLGGVLRLVHRDGEAASVQRDRYDKGSCAVDVKDSSDKRAQAAASVHAVYHRRNLLYAASGRGVHHDFCMAGVSGCMELCKRRKRG